MPNHPNRGGARFNRVDANPTPEQIKAARASAGLTETEAAQVVYATPAAWRDWEAGTRRCHPAFFELFKIKTGRVGYGG